MDHIVLSILTSMILPGAAAGFVYAIGNHQPVIAASVEAIFSGLAGIVGALMVSAIFNGVFSVIFGSADPTLGLALGSLSGAALLLMTQEFFKRLGVARPNA